MYNKIKKCLQDIRNNLIRWLTLVKNQNNMLQIK